MKILTIGNSFSQDATRYLNKIATAMGDDFYVVNLCIGGCPLERHYNNMLSGEAAYEKETNGSRDEDKISLEGGLSLCDFDVVTLQQVSHYAIKYETYQPYLDKLAEYVRSKQKNAKIYFQQTWGYKPGSDRLTVELGYKTTYDMFADVKAAYEKACEAIGADGIIPSGALMAECVGMGMEDQYRDQFHASLGAGRFAIAMLWYCFFTGRSPFDIPAIALDTPASESDIAIARAAVQKVLEGVS